MAEIENANAFSFCAKRNNTVITDAGNDTNLKEYESISSSKRKILRWFENFGLGKNNYQLQHTALTKTGATKIHTVEPRYLELGYLEHLAISNCFSLP